MHQRKLGSDLTVSAIGLGCMGMSHGYGGQDEAESLKTLHRAIEIGVTFWDTAEVYGPFKNEELVGKALKGRRDKVTVATKFGFRIDRQADGTAATNGTDSRPEHVRQVAEECLSRLGIETIDLFYQHRVDPDVPIEETVGAMADLVKAGKVRALGLSEAGPDTIRRAHATHPIAALQNEYSLFTRDPEDEILPLCAKLGISLVPYSPLGRGQLTGSLTSPDQLGENDFRRNLPRFQAEAMAANAALVETLKSLAEARGVTAAQLALAWLLSRRDFIVPIPGARKIKHLEENAAAADIRLTEAEQAEIGEKLAHVAGARYRPDQLAMTGR
ncbi:aldo/keto reductase [Jiella sp. MQZ9-1]|uniref:Aldo/keto reductase n=1 Tax=Jiella flava TaxID=2816857 RepID=A0A939JWJ9_9HYPH|nr:aldo/keto reductase [Jiella flava]MBO0663589.1 aldo/keto reductase [Jiella flava]MCD2472165.1 aldo/keto reductase [Jiella flava]